MSKQRSQHERPVYYVTGEKGGVGKTLVTKGVVHWVDTQGKDFVVVDSDTSNPDVARAYGAGVADKDMAKAAKGRALDVRTLSLDFLDGWAALVDCAQEHPEAVLVVNVGARGRLVSDPGAQRVWGVADAAEDGILAGLRDAGRPFVVLWVTDGEQDSLQLLKRFRKEVGEEGAVHVVKNWGRIPVGTLAPWAFFDESNTAEAVREAGGHIVEYPALATQVAKQMVNDRLPIARALETEPKPVLSAGSRMVLEGWWRKASVALETMLAGGE